jgi:hypothetical protein
MWRPCERHITNLTRGSEFQSKTFMESTATWVPKLELPLQSQKASHTTMWAVNMRNAVLWKVTPCGSCEHLRFGGEHRLHHQGDIVFLRSLSPFAVTANVFPSSTILFRLMMEAIRYFEPSVFTTATRRNIPEDGILHSQSRETLKSYIALTGWTL